MTKLTIAVDAMGGDHGISVSVPAARECLKQNQNLNLILVGDERAIKSSLEHSEFSADQLRRVRVQAASEVVGMDEKPSSAMRNKKDSSMRVAVNLVKSKEADACVSAGNTGALMAISRFVLKTFKEIDRPAIVFNMPGLNGHCHLLDLGANIDCSAEQLFQFGLMGTILAKAVDGIDRPRVGLLNIGEEEIKGNEAIRQAADMFTKNDSINYIGFIEGDGIYSGEADVVVCDGFVGNVALKSSEGVAKVIGQIIKEELQRNWLTKMGALLTMPLWKAMARRMDPGEYNGGTLVGLRGTVVKSHGGADVNGFSTAIRLAVIEAEKNVPALIEEWFLQSSDGVEV
ncbi:MAG: phosphate acyltransferase [Gammaproteobacteria bacterium]|nr:MAG: phosphate acyltransferase [Gammaproteobacteria bacterium]